MNNNSNLSIDEIKELGRTGVIRWFDAVKAEMEQTLGVELTEIMPEMHTESSCYMPCYLIVDPAIDGSDSILLYVFYRCETEEPTSFCFKNSDGWSIPLDVHTQKELDGLKIINECTSYKTYLTPIKKLTREAYLNAVANASTAGLSRVSQVQSDE